jgi:predicted AAA+ superfamily ATPase
MKRKAELDLKKWYESTYRKPLVLRGARQVGKSTLVRNFAAGMGLDLIEVNFEKVSLKTPDQSLDLKLILPEIEYLTKKRFGPKTLLFLDEIQDSPKMITGLRFFKEDRPDIAVIAAGSLLEFALSTKEISIPVGRIAYYHLGPFTFTEFLNATGNHRLLEVLADYKNIPEFADEALKKLYLKYLYIGGMPEVIQTYIQTENNLNEVRKTQEFIIQSFRDDFHKYSTRTEIVRVRKVFDSMTRIIGKKVKYTEIDSDEKSRDLKRAIELLVFARVILPSLHSNGTSAPLKAFEDSSVYKLFFLDVGLLGCLFNTNFNAIEADKSLRGILAEQFIAQHISELAGSHITPQLHFWLNDKKVNRAEVDFLIELGSAVFPVEVKSGSTGHLKSLFLYLANHKSIKKSVHFGSHSFALRKLDYHIASGNESLAVKAQLFQVPLYLVEQLKDILRI